MKTPNYLPEIIDPETKIHMDQAEGNAVQNALLNQIIFKGCEYLFKLYGFVIKSKCLKIWTTFDRPNNCTSVGLGSSLR